MARITITDEKLYTDIVDYCKENGERISDFCTKLLKGAFAVEVYGDVPFGFVVAETAPPVKEEPQAVVETVEKQPEVAKEAQEIIDKHMEMLKEKNEKPRKRRL